MQIKTFFVTDAREKPGKIYQVNGGVESTFYSRPSGNIYSMAFSPTGQLYFVNANEFKIYRVIRFWGWVFTFTVYTHSTYVRDIAFDSAGDLYFSEATGAGADGKVYKLSGGSATLFQDVTLAEVGGFWAGDFTFDTRDELYISSGNRVPASIYRHRDGAWQLVYTDSSDPIKGLTFLACDLLCYANWRSEVYLLDVVSGTRDMLYSNPMHLWLSDIALFRPKIEVPTLYEGTQVYSCDSTCWRDSGTVDDTWDFTDINANNADIAALMADIGAPTAPTTNDADIWARTRTVWAWLQSTGLNPGDANYDAALAYRSSLGHWPSIAELAHMFVTWGGFWWGGCTCMCRAQMLATLLYRVGIPSDRMAIAESMWKPTYSQHMYVVLKVGCHWYYIDPTSSTPTLNATPENIGGGSADYTHPNSLYLIPGSTLTKPMLVR